jgi:hypothetical protein
MIFEHESFSSARRRRRPLLRFVRFAATLALPLGLALLARPARATIVDHTYPVHNCHFSSFSDLTTCPTAGFCLPPKFIDGNNIFTLDNGKLQPRTETQSGTPLSFMCPIMRTLSGAAADIHAHVAGAGAGNGQSALPLKCTLYAVNKTGLPVLSATGQLDGHADGVIKGVKLTGVGSDNSYNIRCDMPIAKPFLLTKQFPASWTASASLNNADAGKGIDATGTSTRWTTGVAMASGQTYTVDMKGPQTFYMIKVDHDTNDYARAFDVQVSDDGNSFQTIWSDVAATEVVNISVPTQTKRYIRIRQTGSSGSANRWWSIRDLGVYQVPAENLSTTLNSYRMEESSTTTDMTVRTYPASVCVARGSTNNVLSHKLRFYNDGITNRDTSNITVECPMAHPFSPSTPRTGYVAISEAKSSGGSSCRMTARYMSYNTDFRSSTSASSSSAAGNFWWSFSDSTDYQESIRFGMTCTLTPGSSLRMLRLDSN